VHDGGDYGLVALSPMGVEIFGVTITDDDVLIDGPSEWVGMLKRLPWRRDLGLLQLWSCPEGRCRAPGGKVIQRPIEGGVQLRWRGVGGRAKVVRRGGRSILTDPNRRYTLEIITEVAP